MTDHTPDRCYAKGEKEGSDRPIHLDLEPRRTHAKARDYLHDHASARIYVLSSLFHAFAHASHGPRLSQDRIKHTCTLVCSCTVYKRKALPASLILTAPVLLAVRSELKFPGPTDPTMGGGTRSRSNLSRASGIQTLLCRKKKVWKLQGG